MRIHARGGIVRDVDGMPAVECLRVIPDVASEEAGDVQVADRCGIVPSGHLISKMIQPS